MRIIVCNIQMFSNDQMIYVFDTETKENIFAQKVDLNSIPDVVCALAHQYGTTEVKLHGDLSFNTLFAQEIIGAAKAAAEYTLTKYSNEKKEVKAKGEVVDEYHKVQLTKVFTDIKEPDVQADVIYEV